MVIMVRQVNLVLLVQQVMVFLLLLVQFQKAMLIHTPLTIQTVILQHLQ
nr:MAG TPA: hypothetical protein [Caudoviricetes sp.]